MMLPFTVWLLFATNQVTLPQRSIDRCAQDGAYFYAMSDDPTRPVQVERDGVAIRIEHPDPCLLYTSILSFIAETREYAAGALRTGDRPDGREIADHLESVAKGLPPTVKICLLYTSRCV